nr:hypothetical protein [Burkholderia ambifaria]
MTENVEGVAKIVDVLRSVPFWLFAGIAVAAVAVLTLPSVGALTDPALRTFRDNWGGWIYATMVVSGVLAAARLLADAWTAHQRRRHARVLFLQPLIQQSWWHLARQLDGSSVSQLQLRVHVSNRSDAPVRLLDVRLTRPWRRGSLLMADVALPDARRMYSRNHAVPPGQVSEAVINVSLRGRLKRQGRPLRISVSVTDQNGATYRLSGIRLRTMDPVIGLREGIAQAWKSRKQEQREDEAPLPTVWEHAGRFADVDAVLLEEQRQYAANGRIRGGLGSLNVTLQHEPDGGVVRVGDVPVLLWRADQRPPAVSSENLARLLRLHAAADANGKATVEDYLLSHLNRRSPYADIAYFVFLALHRCGRTVDAVAAAQRHLAGDQVFGYSNLLGTLAALVSREHFEMDPRLYDELAMLLADDKEHNFKLLEKMNLARLQHNDAHPRAAGPELDV